MLKFRYLKLSQIFTFPHSAINLLKDTARQYRQTVQPNDAITKRNFSKFCLRSTNSLFKTTTLN